MDKTQLEDLTVMAEECSRIAEHTLDKNNNPGPQFRNDDGDNVKYCMLLPAGTKVKLNYLCPHAGELVCGYPNGMLSVYYECKWRKK